MNLKLSFLAFLGIFSSMTSTSLAGGAEKTWGCGENGICWKWCERNEREGWCYTNQICTEKGTHKSRQCSSDLECTFGCNRKWS